MFYTNYFPYVYFNYNQYIDKFYQRRDVIDRYSRLIGKASVRHGLKPR